MQTDAREQLIGPYRLQRQVGSGGMGTVYLARRTGQDFEQPVALKVLRGNRFRQQGQILAALDHPNIVRLLDAGTTADGLPFLVMEFVDGLNLTEHCRNRNLPLEARLKLFRKICAAVHHAHQRLIIHRDLKPANILVTADGEPKILDFGIETGPELLTPRYASPEQTAGGPLTTASDIYTLGLLLTELVDGQAAPSADLATIVQTALRPEPERRYQSAEQLADDIRRYQENLPITARPDTLFYIASKFVARHRFASAAALFSLLAMLLTIAVLAAEIHNANQQRLRAQRINAYMQDMLGGAGSGKRGRDLKVVDVLTSAAASLDSKLKDQPVEAAELRATIGYTFSKLGLLPAADSELRTALAAQSNLLGQDSPAVAETLFQLGSTEHYEGQMAAAESHLRRAVALFQRHNDLSSLEEATNSLAIVLFQEEHFRDAGVYFEQLVQRRRALHNATDIGLLSALNNLAQVRLVTGDFTGAAQLQRQVFDAYRQRDAHAAPSMEMAVAELNLGESLRLSGDAASAEPLVLAAEGVLKSRLGDAHWITATAECEAAQVYSALERYAHAEQEARAGLATLERAVKPGHREFARAWIALGTALTGEGKTAEAEPYLRDAFSLRQTLSQKGGLRIAQAAYPLAVCLMARKRYSEAKSFAQMAYINFKANYGEQNRFTQAALARLKELP